MSAVDTPLSSSPLTRARVIVAAFDGSPNAEAALLWAVEEAMRRGESVEVVQVVPPTDLGAEARAAQLDAKVDSLVRHSGAVAGPVRSEVCRGSRVRTLQREARAVDADLLVMGTTRSLVHDLVNGMVGDGLAHPGRRPVVVVPAPSRTSDRPSGGITVGVDGSVGGRAALRWALSEGKIRQAPVRVVMAWTNSPFKPAYGAVPIFAENDAMARAEAKAAVESEVEVVRRTAEGIDGVEVTVAPVQGSATEVLNREAGRCDLLVVGNRRRNALTALLLGSTARTCVRHCTSPVVIVPAAWRSDRS